MKQLILLFLVVFSLPSFAQVNVTFQVNMQNQTGFTTPEVNGTFNGWCGNCNAMTDANADGIWEVTLPLSPGSYEYKFSADSWGSQESLIPGSSCTVSNFGFTNRTLTVGTGDLVLPVVCWGSCSNCTTVYPVTFQVDMNTVTSTYTQVQLGGQFNSWNPPANPMTDANNDGIYETTLNLAPGTYEYKFAADNWAISENLTAGTSCTVTNFGFTNRVITVTNAGQVLDAVCWGSCLACSVVPPTYTVTFQLNMQGQTGFTTPEVNGTFNSWCGNCNPLSDANADGIWETTLTLPAGAYEYKFSADAWNTQENLTPGSSCTVTNGGFTNRSLNLTSNTVLSPVCWGLCTNCLVAGCTNATAVNYNPAANSDDGSCLYATNFNVDMTCAGTYTNVYITGPWCAWCGADTYNVLTDPNNDGIYNVTLNLPAGNVEYKYMVDNWASQENLIDDMQNGGTCAPITDYANYANRLIAVGTTTNDVYGRCSACQAGIPGCIDPTAVNFNPTATYTDNSCLYATVFNVDMNCAGTTFSNVYISGPWCGWCGADTYNHLTDANGDGIYTVTVNLGAGNVEYKYMVDNWASQENLVDDMQNGGTCAPVTDYWSYANRQSPTGQVKNDVYGRCSACPILGCTVSSACNYNPLANQNDGSCTYASLWYLDSDADGYYVSSTSSCASPGAGYTATAGISGDCNDSNAAVNAGHAEVCGNLLDDNCNGQVNEGCPVGGPGENPSNAVAAVVSNWPNCSSVNGTLVGALPSSAAQSVCLTGEDKWYQFVATSEAVSIVVNSTSNDIVIELQTAGGTLVASENSVTGLGGEILTTSGLVSGQLYKLGIRNFDSNAGIGSFTVCVRMLKRGGCDYGAGPYSLCQYFKATWAGGSGSSYRYTFTGLTGPAAGNTYTRTQATDICVLSNVTPTMPYGSTYSLLITNIFTVNNAAGQPVVVEVPATSPCTVATIAEPVTALRLADQCITSPKFRGSLVASTPWVCGVTNWRWKFTEVDPITHVPAGIPFEVSRGAASNYLSLGNVAQLQYGKTYAVQTAPVLSYTSTNYAWGPETYLCIVGTAALPTENEITTEKSLHASEMNSLIYPNPANHSATLQISSNEEGVAKITVYNSFGKLIINSTVSLTKGGITSLPLNTENLSSGLYSVQIISGKKTENLKFIVEH